MRIVKIKNIIVLIKFFDKFENKCVVRIIVNIIVNKIILLD